jgi:hypothetical protein
MNGATAIIRPIKAIINDINNAGRNNEPGIKGRSANKGVAGSERF